MQKGEQQAKYYRLKEHLKEEILLGKIKPGEQIASENSLAEAFSLSRHTVRKAISMLVNEGYLYTEHGRGTYCMDRSRIRHDSKNIGVITTYISEYIFPRVIHGVDSVLSGNGYSIMLKNTSNDTEKEAICIEDMLSKDIEGLIIEPTKSALFSNNLKYYKALDNHHIPYVFIHGCYQKLEDKSQVILDDEAGAYKAVEYLARLGHKNIIGIFKADDVQGLNRHKGYAKALVDYNLQYDPDRVIWYHTEDKFIKPYSVIKQMLKSKYAVDAVLCYNDEIAFKMFEMFRDMGINVPEDISIIGFDDSYLSENCPVKLTTISHPKENLGKIAAEILLELLKNDDYLNNPIKKTIVPELIIKNSCIQR